MFVEGIDDARFVESILARAGRADEVEIIPVEGKTKFSPILAIFSGYDRFEDVSAIALIRDSDDDPAAAFASLKTTVEAIGIDCSSAVPNQWLKKPGQARILLATIPDKRQGCLEDLCWASIGDDPVLHCVTSYLNCCDSQHPASAAALAPREQSKRRIATYLSSAVAKTGPFDAGVSLGLAAEIGLFNFSSAAIAPLAATITGF